MGKNGPLVSVIMPVFNGELFVSEAIDSLITQTFANWELLIINDGSTDRSEEIILDYNDKRIRYFKQKNKGVSTARNVGLNNMTGEFICFLDADDILPANSLSARIKVYEKDDSVEFVDGAACIIDIHSNQMGRTYCPDFAGNPFNELIDLSGKCFFGPTWMIRVSEAKKYNFDERMSHGEDLLFYLSISHSGIYDFTDEVTYHYRKGNKSAMTNLRGLEKGYFNIYSEITNWNEVSDVERNLFLKKIKSIMFKSYISNYKLLSAIKVLFAK